ncbi:hypothetical protein DI487_07345 [Flavobacterium sediminis]|uniref:Uncharacterized protein n=1 Tax=Flavobacterium sediminis TaxID=2201181 RepID=A0A2U8QV02_9FLAO|nr:hypothetical protein DI487_07345 [Flavobacterium sediminis]
MSFFEDIIVTGFQDAIFNSFRWIGIAFKWILYLGKKPFNQIKMENWNNRIGFLITVLIIAISLYLLNS